MTTIHDLEKQLEAAAARIRRLEGELEYQRRKERAAGQRGMERIATTTPMEVMRDARHSVFELAQTRMTFTAYHVAAHHEQVGMRATREDGRFWGPILRAAAHAGWIEPTEDYEPTGSHGRPQRVWRSRLRRHYNYKDA